MPIEIRELVIKASIGESGSEAEVGAGSSSESMDREGIIAECVDQVMEIMRNKEER